MTVIQAKSKLTGKSYKWRYIHVIFYFSGEYLFWSIYSTSCGIYPLRVFREYISVHGFRETIQGIAEYSKLY